MITITCDLCKNVIAERPSGVNADAVIDTEIILGTGLDYITSRHPKRYFLCDKCSEKLAGIIKHWND